MVFTLKHVHVRNFKGLEDLRLTLDRGLTLLIGPNNSGKSNLLDCFAFLGDLIRNPATAVESRGGFASLIYQGDLKRVLSIEIAGQWKGSKPSPSVDFSYRMEIAGGPAHWVVSDESFKLLRDGNPVELIATDRARREWYLLSEAGERLLSTGLGSHPALAQVRGYTDPKVPEVLVRFANNVLAWQRYRLPTQPMRGQTPIRRELLLDSDGSNVATVLHELYTRHLPLFLQVQSTLQAVTSETDQLIAAVGQPGQTYVEIKEGEMLVPAWSMSDGTLRALAILCLAFSPGSPGIICLEEPELHLHPEAIRLVVEALVAMSEKHQVLCTTHSPLLLDLVKLSQVRVLERRRGPTALSSFRGSKELRERLNSLGLGEAWLGGHIGGVRE